MKNVHLFNDHIYLISGQAVARNPLFHNRSIRCRFLTKMDKYLSPFCEIIHYNLGQNQFQLLVKLRSRVTFCAYIRKLESKPDLTDAEIDWTTHIFSRAMSRLLASCAIHFNRKYGRSGALFARRFSRKLITSQQSLEHQIARFNEMDLANVYAKEWNKSPLKFRSKYKKRKMRKRKEYSGFYYYTRPSKKHQILNSFRRINNLELRAQFENLPPNSIYDIVHRIDILVYINKASEIP